MRLHCTHTANSCFRAFVVSGAWGDRKQSGWEGNGNGRWWEQGREQRDSGKEREVQRSVLKPLCWPWIFPWTSPSWRPFSFVKFPLLSFLCFSPPTPPPFHMPRVLPWLLSTQQVMPKGSSQLNQGKASSNLIATSLIPLGFLVINFLMQCFCETAVFSAGEKLVT